MKKALFVIDFQEDFVGNTVKKPFPISNSEEIIKNVNNHILEYQTNDDEIIYVCDVLPNNWFFRLVAGRALAKTDGVKICSKIIKVNDFVYEKRVQNAFSNDKLLKYIKDKMITNIELTGLDGTLCIAATASFGVKLGLNVTILSDSVGTLYPKKLPAVYEKLKSKGVLIN